MIKVCDVMCPDKRQAFLNVSLSRNTVADRACELAANLHEQLMERENIILHTPLLWMRAATHLVLPSCQCSSVEWTRICALQRNFWD